MKRRRLDIYDICVLRSKDFSFGITERLDRILKIKLKNKLNQIKNDEDRLEQESNALSSARYKLNSKMSEVQCKIEKSRESLLEEIRNMPFNSLFGKKERVIELIYKHLDYDSRK